MGKVPGVAAGYETAPSAIVNGEEINQAGGIQTTPFTDLGIR